MVNNIVSENNVIHRLLTLYPYKFRDYGYFLVNNVNNRMKWEMVINNNNKKT